MKNLLFPVESSLHIFMTIFLPLNSSMIWILVRQGIASTVPDSSLIFCSDKAVLRLCIFTLYLRTKFKETSLYLQFDFIVFMHSFRSYYFLNQAWTNCSDTQNLWTSKFCIVKKKKTIDLQNFSWISKLMKQLQLLPSTIKNSNVLVIFW